MTVLVDGELVLYGFVGDTFWGEGFTAREVVDALAEIGRDTDVVVRINSGGGYVDDGIAIFNSLLAHKGKVTVMVDAQAASSASVIAMAGDERIMRKGAMMMIHDPSSVVWGTAADMTKAVKMLEKHGENLAGIYAEITGEDPDVIRADMKEELWLTADEAVERGFATSASDTRARAAAAFDYSVYAHAPQRLTALASKRNWSRNEARPTAQASAPAATRQKLEKSTMTDKTPAEDKAADTAAAIAEATAKGGTDAKDRIKAILNSEEAKGRETLANHFAFESDLAPDAAIAALKVAPKADAGGSDGRGGSYEQRRLAAANLARPAGDKPEAAANTSILADAVARVNKRR